jgi:hypothetical protein
MFLNIKNMVWLEHLDLYDTGWSLEKVYFFGVPMGEVIRVGVEYVDIVLKDPTGKTHTVSGAGLGWEFGVGTVVGQQSSFEQFERTLNRVSRSFVKYMKVLPSFSLSTNIYLLSPVVKPSRTPT